MDLGIIQSLIEAMSGKAQAAQPTQGVQPQQQDNSVRIAELLRTDKNFAVWKQKNAPQDSGRDYDLYGAYKAGLQPSANGHWPDTFKLPNHPRFSVESQYWKPGLPAGRWEGEKYLPMDAKTAHEWVLKYGQNMAPIQNEY